MLDKIKKALKIKNSINDEDIQRTIDSCLADLCRVGIGEADSKQDEPLIFNLCVLYCHSFYNTDGDGEIWRVRYERQRDAVSMSKEYGGES